MNKLKNILGIAMAMSIVSESNYRDYSNDKLVKKAIKNNTPLKTKNKPLLYFFREDGTFLIQKQNDITKKEEFVYDCLAINEINAKRKFINWKNKQL